LAGAAVGVEFFGELAGLVGDVAVVAEGGAAGGEGAVQDGVDFVDEGGDLFWGEAAELLLRVEFCGPEGFVDVDVAEAGDVFLGEEALFEAGAGLLPVGEVGGGDGEGVGAEVLGFGGEGFLEGRVEGEATEAARVAEADIVAIGEGEEDVGVFGDGGIGGDAIDAAGHAEVEDEGRVGGFGGDEEEFFAVAMGAGEVAIGEGSEGGVFWLEEIGAEDFYGADFLAEEKGFQGSADFFDFGEFRHFIRV